MHGQSAAAISLRKEMIASVEDLRKAQEAGVPLIDDRPEERFIRINQHPTATTSGTLVGAKNLPNSWLTVNDMGEFRKKSQLEQLYKLAGIPTSGEQFNFCNTGHWASVGWFVSSAPKGNKSAKLYDGSMVECTMVKAGPVEQKVKLQCKCVLLRFSSAWAWHAVAPPRGPMGSTSAGLPSNMSAC